MGALRPPARRLMGLRGPVAFAMLGAAVPRAVPVIVAEIPGVTGADEPAEIAGRVLARGATGAANTTGRDQLLSLAACAAVAAIVAAFGRARTRH